jgi:prepilin-type processing-associated H-X9-DG protein
MTGGDNGARTVIYDLSGLPLSVIKEPSRTWMLVESGYGRAGSGNLYDTAGYGMHGIDFTAGTVTYPEQSGYFHPDQHFDGSNVAFADGHVKWVKNGDGKNWIFDLNRAP